MGAGAEGQGRGVSAQFRSVKDVPSGECLADNSNTYKKGKNMPEKTVIEIAQEGQMNGAGRAYKVETENPDFLNSFVVGYMKLSPEERSRVWGIVRDAFWAANRLGICKLEYMKD